jgi:hypothetical protein
MICCGLVTGVRGVRAVTVGDATADVAKFEPEICCPESLGVANPWTSVFASISVSGVFVITSSFDSTPRFAVGAAILTGSKAPPSCMGEGV